MVGLECWPVQSEGQEIDGQPSRPIDLVKSGHLSPSSIGVNDAPSFEGQLLLQRIASQAASVCGTPTCTKPL